MAPTPPGAQSGLGYLHTAPSQVSASNGTNWGEGGAQGEMRAWPPQGNPSAGHLKLPPTPKGCVPHKHRAQHLRAQRAPRPRTAESWRLGACGHCPRGRLAVPACRVPAARPPRPHPTPTPGLAGSAGLEAGPGPLTLADGGVGVGSLVLIPIAAQGGDQPVQEADHVLRGAEQGYVLWAQGTDMPLL